MLLTITLCNGSKVTRHFDTISVAAKNADGTVAITYTCDGETDVFKSHTGVFSIGPDPLMLNSEPVA